MVCDDMKKSDKKIENALRESLTAVCDDALGSIKGFVWLTHLVNYDVFPQSLKIVCVFETDDDLKQALDSQQDVFFYDHIQAKLKAVNIIIKNIRPLVSFDSEETCQRLNNGKWEERFKRVSTLH